MGNDRVETGVDDLIKLLGDGKKHFLDEVAKTLELSLEVLQLWVDFLVEEKIIVIEYSFTKPFIFLNKEVPKESRQSNKITLAEIKKKFMDEGISKKMPMDKLNLFWNNHLDEELNKLKEKFYMEANKRRLQNVDNLWNRYKTKIYGV